MPWLTDMLKKKKWRIPAEDVPEVAAKLELEVAHESYYRTINVWLPDVRWGKECMPCCPNCKTNEHVTVNGFRDNHPSRTIVGLYKNESVISRSYRCNCCRKKRQELKEQVTNFANSNGAQVIVSNIRLRYTFMASNSESLPLLPYGRGDLFPAFLTSRAGVDKSLIDLMRPLFNAGVKPSRFAAILKELHAKRHMQCLLEYEREYKCNRRLNADLSRAEYSTPGNKNEYNDAVPSPKYIEHVYKRHHFTIRAFLDNEVKKRGATTLHWDVSYKEAKNLCNYLGQPIYHGLVTALNEFGEIRIQFHIYTDGHDQMEAALNAFKTTTKMYGMPEVRLFFTGEREFDCHFAFTSLTLSYR